MEFEVLAEDLKKTLADVRAMIRELVRPVWNLETRRHCVFLGVGWGREILISFFPRVPFGTERCDYEEKHSEVWKQGQVATGVVVNGHSRELCSFAWKEDGKTKK